MAREMSIDFSKVPAKMMSVEPVAIAGFRALERGQPTVIPGGMNRTMNFMGGLFGRSRMAVQFGKIMANATGALER